MWPSGAGLQRRCGVVYDQKRGAISCRVGGTAGCAWLEAAQKLEACCTMHLVGRGMPHDLHYSAWLRGFLEVQKHDYEMHTAVCSCAHAGHGTK